MTKKKSYPSTKVDRLKIIFILLGFILLIVLPKPSIAEPRIDKKGVYWMYSVETEEQQIKRYIAKTFPEQPQIALAVFTAESHLKPCAHGDSGNRLAPEGSWGVAQINKAVHKELIGDRDLCNWKDNIDIAREIWEVSGWRPWSAFNNGSYKSYE